MGNFGDTILDTLNTYAGVNRIKGSYSETEAMEATDVNGTEFKCAYPVLSLAKRENDGVPKIYFKRKKEKVKIECEFELKTNIEGTTSILLRPVNIWMNIKPEKDGNAVSKMLSVDLGFGHPQSVTGTLEISIDELDYYVSAFENNRITFSWKATITWVDVSEPGVLEKIKTEGYTNYSKTAEATGDPIPALIEKKDPEAYKEIDSLICWQEFVNHENTIYYKNGRNSNSYYFLPQIYRISAKSDNMPRISLTLKNDKNLDKIGDYEVVMGFQMSPYIHPKAKRELYQQIASNDKVPFCNLEYGGYDAVRFEWSPAMNKGYMAETGFISLVDESQIKAEPGSVFSISFKCVMDLMEKFKEQLKTSGIEIGYVWFDVTDNLGTKQRSLGPIKVELNLLKLANTNLEVQIVEREKITDLFTTAIITNKGEMPVTIGGCAISMLAENDSKVIQAFHNLECKGDWNTILRKGEHMEVKLTNEAIEKLKAKDNSFARIVKKIFKFLTFRKEPNYWTRLVCEPYSVQLLEDDITLIANKWEEVGIDDAMVWKMEVGTNLEWNSHLEIKSVEVQIKNDYGINDLITLNSSKFEEIRMTRTTNGYLSTKNSLSARTYQYRFRALTDSGNTNWSDWYDDGDSSVLIVNESEIIKLINI